MRFSDKYGRKRHQRNIHDHSCTLPCPVYKCERNRSSFGRPDKFHHHVRTEHYNPQEFLFPMEACRQGPFSGEALKNHLEDIHRAQSSRQTYLDDVLRSIQMRRIEAGPSCLAQLKDEGIYCPFNKIVCLFRCKEGQLQSHLQYQHIFMDPSDGTKVPAWELPKENCHGSNHSDFVALGSGNCPVCYKEIHNLQMFVSPRVARVLHKQYLLYHL